MSILATLEPRTAGTEVVEPAATFATPQVGQHNQSGTPQRMCCLDAYSQHTHSSRW